MKYAAILITLVFVSVAFAQTTPAADSKAGNAKAEKKSAKSKASRLQGHIVRINKDKSTISIRGTGKQGFEREISYDSSTKWTKLGKPADESDFKEGSFVIAVGKPDDKGNFHADRIDLRLPR